jgi:hypothetical protein
MLMATTPHHDAPFTSYTGAGSDLGVELLPLPSESPADYLARLKAIHARVGALIGAIETRRPILGPIPQPPAPRRLQPDRREPEHAERRTAVADRRVGLPDERAVPINRRFGPRDRRHRPVERREEIARRRDPSPVPWKGHLRLDGTTAMWVLQVIAWTAVAAVTLIYGIGR